MRYSFFNFLLICFFSIVSLNTKAQNTFRTTPSSVIGYLEYLPQDYNTNSDKYPVVIFLHGLGERGPATSDINKLKNGIWPVEKNGPPKYVKYGTHFPFILISPQLKSNYGDWSSKYIMEVINYCKTYLRIDERRIYITGLSLGGGGTWTLAEENPTLFAAIVPICGSKNSGKKADFLAEENLPVWAFHGDDDRTVPMSRTVAMVTAINNCKPAPNPRAKLTIYPGVKHNSWEKAYTTDHSVQTPNVYEWMLSYTNTINGSNKIPLANAGQDQTIQGDNLIISGSGSDGDGSISSYSWEKISGPAAILNGGNAAKLSLTGLVTGVYVFRLRVTDNMGDSDADYIKVTVKNIPDGGANNLPPVVSAGVDKVIKLPDNSAVITASASDKDGKIIAYQWTKISGNSAALSGETSSTLAISNLISGAYVFRLTVKDDKGLSASDDVAVTVDPAPDIHTLSVSAGPDRVVKLPVRKVTLFGLATDTGAKIVSYSWVKVSGGECEISDLKILRPKLLKYAIGTYVFRLTVTDNKGTVKSDETTMTFENANVAPVVDAGPNRIVSLPVARVTLFGVATDPDGKIVSCTWTKVSGGACTFSNNKELRPELSSLSPGKYVFKLSVTDNKGTNRSDETIVVFESADAVARGQNENDTISSTHEDLEILMPGSVEFAFTENRPQTDNPFATIYNEQGARIFEGKWNAELYDHVFNRQGLYIYQVVINGKRQSGKIYITDN